MTPAAVPAARRGRGCDGGATVTACLALTALLLVTVVIVQFAAVVCARHRAQSAADSAALAAAGALDSGAEAACDQADSVVRRMRMRVRTCSVRDWDVTVTVDGSVTLALLGKRSVVAIARAGPVNAVKRS
ncbi:Rv3654c family TadE-like protein [Nocardia africana]|uniref:Predicted membrane protein n=1 Tax=Nocardia africana TaxID=134964 RepID=A0A378WLZ1_9NOCA|nr:Rv3654c family TadE-like protein [Nocardia africana]MCC3316298.1 flp pilus-assembly TadE/G-like family protein [Nocardia africana]SUA41353.1 Predicted membrane protein [Nocardia africana]